MERERTALPLELPAEAGSYASGPASERQQLNGRISEFCKSYLGDHYGIEFRAVDLTDMLPPDELADALNAMMRAHSEAAAHYARAEASCSQRVLAAERGVEIARSSAGAVEEEMTQLASYLDQMHKSGTLDLYLQAAAAPRSIPSRAPLFVRRNS